MGAAHALGKIGIEAVEPLIKLLSDNNLSVRWGAAWALENIWNDKQAVKAINHFLAVENVNLSNIVSNYISIIKKGKQGSENWLILALQQAGTMAMAEACLNSGNPLLEEGGRYWARSHGYMIRIHYSGETGPKWGK